MKIKKIGIDLDDLDLIQLTKYFKKHNTFICKLINKLVCFESASKTGFHLELYLKKSVTIEQSFKIRETLEDCKYRLLYSKRDYKKGWDFDILFKYKKIKGEWKQREYLFSINKCLKK